LPPTLRVTVAPTPAATHASTAARSMICATAAERALAASRPFSASVPSPAVPLAPEHVHVGTGLAGAPTLLAGLARQGDLVLTLGAGDVTTVGPRLLTVLSGGEEARRG